MDGEPWELMIDGLVNEVLVLGFRREVCSITRGVWIGGGYENV